MANRLNDTIEGIDDGISAYPDAGLAAFGFRRLYGEDDTMGRKLFALDLSYGSKGGPLYRKAKWPDWCSAVAKDCAEFDIAPRSEPYFEWAFAIFTL